MSSEEAIRIAEEAMEVARNAKEQAYKVHDKLIVETSKRHEVGEAHSKAIKEHSEWLEELTKISDRLTYAMKGDPDMGQEGFSERLKDVEEISESAAQGMKRFYTIGGTLSAIWGGLVVVASILISIFKD